MQTRDDHRGGRARLLASAALGLALVAAIGTRGDALAAVLLPPPDWQDFEGFQEWPRLAMDDGPPTALPILPLPPVPGRPPEEEVLSAMPLPEVTTLPPVRSSSWPALLTAGPRSYYALVEVLALQRDNQSCNVPLVVDAFTDPPPPETLLTTGDLNPGMALGGRAFVGFRNADGRGLEAGYLGAYGMTAERTLTGDENLQLAGFLKDQVLPFNGADTVTATYVSSVNSAELNLFASCCGCGGCVAGPGGVDGCGAWCIDWLGGFRYVNVAEQAGLVFTCCTTTTGPFTSSYDVRTSNNLLGGQFGGRVRRSWKNWAIESWAKTGVFANVASQSQDPIIDPTGSGTVVRDARGGNGVEPAMLADLNLSLIYRINRVWGIRLGYNAIWIGGVALAPEQWNFTTDGDAGYALVQNGGIFMNGANLGLEARW